MLRTDIYHKNNESKFYEAACRFIMKIQWQVHNSYTADIYYHRSCYIRLEIYLFCCYKFLHFASNKLVSISFQYPSVFSLSNVIFYLHLLFALPYAINLTKLPLGTYFLPAFVSTIAYIPDFILHALTGYLNAKS